MIDFNRDKNKWKSVQRQRSLFKPNPSSYPSLTLTTLTKGLNDNDKSNFKALNVRNICKDFRIGGSSKSVQSLLDARIGFLGNNLLDLLALSKPDNFEWKKRVIRNLGQINQWPHCYLLSASLFRITLPSFTNDDIVCFFKKSEEVYFIKITIVQTRYFSRILQVSIGYFKYFQVNLENVQKQFLLCITDAKKCRKVYFTFCVREIFIMASENLEHLSSFN